MIDSATKSGGSGGGLGCADLPAGPWIVFVRKPGDEILAMGGSLLRARSEGKDVAVVYLNAGEDADLAFLPELRRIFVDSGLGCDLDLSALAAQVREINPAAVFYPSRLEDTPDLRAVASAATTVPLGHLNWRAWEMSIAPLISRPRLTQSAQR